MGSLFSKKKQPSRVTEQDRAVLQLKQQRDKLKQYQRKLSDGMARDRLTAKKLLANKQKDKALLLLKKKRFTESLMSKTEGQLDNIHTMINTIEFTQIEQQVLDGLKSGNEALKQLQQLYTLEDVENIMDETHDARAYTDQINELIGGQLTAEDDEAVLREYEAITNLENLETTEQLPSVPTDELPQLQRENLPREREQAGPSAVLAS